MQIVIDQLLTNFQREGNGSIVLLLHGWGDSLNTFNSIQPELAKFYDVISLDLPGFGQSQAPKEAWNLDNYAKFVDSFVKKLNINVYTIIGHSNGGAIAIEGIATKVLSADKLILLASSGVRPAKTIKKSTFKFVAKVGKIATFWLPNKKRQDLRTKLYGAAGSDMLVAPGLKESFKLIVNQDITSVASQVTIPTLLVYGAEDQSTPTSDGQKLSSLIYNSKLEILPQAGHFVHQDQAEQVLAKIKEFLQ